MDAEPDTGLLAPPLRASALALARLAAARAGVARPSAAAPRLSRTALTVLLDLQPTPWEQLAAQGPCGGGGGGEWHEGGEEEEEDGDGDEDAADGGERARSLAVARRLSARASLDGASLRALASALASLARCRHVAAPQRAYLPHAPRTPPGREEAHMAAPGATRVLRFSETDSLLRLLAALAGSGGGEGWRPACAAAAHASSSSSSSRLPVLRGSVVLDSTCEWGVADARARATALSGVPSAGALALAPPRAGGAAGYASDAARGAEGVAARRALAAALHAPAPAPPPFARLGAPPPPAPPPPAVPPVAGVSSSSGSLTLFGALTAAAAAASREGPPAPGGDAFTAAFSFAALPPLPPLPGAPSSAASDAPPCAPHTPPPLSPRRRDGAPLKLVRTCLPPPLPPLPSLPVARRGGVVAGATWDDGGGGRWACEVGGATGDALFETLCRQARHDAAAPQPEPPVALATLLADAAAALRGSRAAARRLAAPRRVRGTSAAAVSCLLAPLLSAAAARQALDAFCARAAAAPATAGGLPAQALASSLRAALRVHDAALDALPAAAAVRRAAEGTCNAEHVAPPLTLLELLSHTERVQRELAALAQLCGSSGSGSGDADASGAALVERAHRAAAAAAGGAVGGGVGGASHEASLLRRLLADAAAPLAAQLDAWAFSAAVADPFGALFAPLAPEGGSGGGLAPLAWAAHPPPLPRCLAPAAAAALAAGAQLRCMAPLPQAAPYIAACAALERALRSARAGAHAAGGAQARPLPDTLSALHRMEASDVAAAAQRDAEEARLVADAHAHAHDDTHTPPPQASLPRVSSPLPAAAPAAAVSSSSRPRAPLFSAPPSSRPGVRHSFVFGGDREEDSDAALLRRRARASTGDMGTGMSRGAGLAQLTGRRSETGSIFGGGGEDAHAHVDDADGDTAALLPQQRAPRGSGLHSLYDGPQRAAEAELTAAREAAAHAAHAARTPRASAVASPETLREEEEEGGDADDVIDALAAEADADADADADASAEAEAAASDTAAPAEAAAEDDAATERSAAAASGDEEDAAAAESESDAPEGITVTAADSTPPTAHAAAAPTAADAFSAPLPLDAALRAWLVVPLRVQYGSVSRACLALARGPVLRLPHHGDALRRFFLFERAGDFGDALVAHLCARSRRSGGAPLRPGDGAAALFDALRSAGVHEGDQAAARLRCEAALAGAPPLSEHALRGLDAFRLRYEPGGGAPLAALLPPATLRRFGDAAAALLRLRHAAAAAAEVRRAAAALARGAKPLRTRARASTASTSSAAAGAGGDPCGALCRAAHAAAYVTAALMAHAGTAALDAAGGVGGGAAIGASARDLFELQRAYAAAADGAAHAAELALLPPRARAAAAEALAAVFDLRAAVRARGAAAPGAPDVAAAAAECIAAAAACTAACAAGAAAAAALGRTECAEADVLLRLDFNGFFSHAHAALAGGSGDVGGSSDADNDARAADAATAAAGAAAGDAAPTQPAATTRTSRDSSSAAQAAAGAAGGSGDAVASV
jgi:hypothetical protein